MTPSPPRRQRKRIGEIFIDAGLITHDQLERALAHKGAMKLGQFLLRNKVLTENQIVKALSEQLNIEVYDKSKLPPDPALKTLVPEEFAFQNKALPVHKRGGLLWLAMCDPTDLPTIDNVMIMTGLDIEPLVCTEGQIESLHRQIYTSAFKAEPELLIGELDLGGIAAPGSGATEATDSGTRLNAFEGRDLGSTGAFSRTQDLSLTQNLSHITDFHKTQDLSKFNPFDAGPIEEILEVEEVELVESLPAAAPQRPAQAPPAFRTPQPVTIHCEVKNWILDTSVGAPNAAPLRRLQLACVEDLQQYGKRKFDVSLNFADAPPQSGLQNGLQAERPLGAATSRDDRVHGAQASAALTLPAFLYAEFVQTLHELKKHRDMRMYLILTLQKSVDPERPFDIPEAAPVTEFAFRLFSDESAAGFW